MQVRDNVPVSVTVDFVRLIPYRLLSFETYTVVKSRSLYDVKILLSSVFVLI